MTKIRIHDYWVILMMLDLRHAIESWWRAQRIWTKIACCRSSGREFVSRKKMHVSASCNSCLREIWTTGNISIC